MISYQNVNNERLLINACLPPVTLPPPARLQVPGNANSTDYGCGFAPGGAREKSIEISNPSVEPAEAPVRPVPTVSVLAVYASDSSLPLGYDPLLPVTELLVNTDFFVRLRIRPSVGLAGYIPTTFTLASVIDGISYGSGAGFNGWAAGDNASNWTGEVYRFPGSYLGQTGIGTLTFLAGQTTLDPVFGSGSVTGPVISAVTKVVANVVQDTWYTGIPASTINATINSVYQGEPLQLEVNGPVSSSYSYTLPWASGTSTTNEFGKDVIPGIGLIVGLWEFTVTFDGVPLVQPFIVLGGLIIDGGQSGESVSGESTSGENSSGDDGDSDGSGVGGDGDGGDGDGGDGGGGDGGGGGGGGGAM